MSAGAVDWDDYAGRITCLAGEVNRGKSRRLLAIIEAALAAGEEDMVLLDLAPAAVRGIGGKLAPPSDPRLTYLTTDITAPRLSGRTPAETQALAEANAAASEGLFRRVEALSCAALFINDVSIYLQAGEPARLLSLIARPATVVINGYFGSSLGGGELGRRERQGMEELFDACDAVVHL